MQLNEAHFADPDDVGSSEYLALHELCQDTLSSYEYSDDATLAEANLAVASVLEELRRHIDDLIPYVSELVVEDDDSDDGELVEYKLISLDEPDEEIRRQRMPLAQAEAENFDMAAIASRSGYGMRRWVAV